MDELKKMLNAKKEYLKVQQDELKTYQNNTEYWFVKGYIACCEEMLKVLGAENKGE